jgi:Cof subfamily protein (haloacid dehalogenase superfamily)
MAPNLPKTLFFDMDNTLIDTQNHKVDASSIQALREVQSKGYKLCLATGREWMMVKYNDVLSILEWDGFVLTNGQLVLDREYREILHITIARHALLEILKVLEEYHLSATFSGETNFRVTDIDESMTIAHNFFNEPIYEREEYTDQPIDKILVYMPRNFDLTPFKKIKGITIVPGISTYCDVIAEHCNKSTGIQALLENMGWENDGYTAFGDSLNDIEMLQHADISVAMGNAVQELKDIADFVTDDAGKDGIANALRKIGYIQ